MSDRRLPLGPAGEAFLAELTDAAYRIALRHGVQGSFLEVQLGMWKALRAVVARERGRHRLSKQEVLF